MSSRETVAPYDREWSRPAYATACSQEKNVSLQTGPFFQKLTYLASDLLAITLAHMLAVRIVTRHLHIPGNVLNPAEYHRFYIPFFAVILYIFDGYKSLELRRPEQELERTCKSVTASFLGLVLFNFMVFRQEAFSRYLVVFWFVLAAALLLVCRFTLRFLYNQLWKAGWCRRRAILLGSAAGLSEYQQLLSIQRHHSCDLVGILTNPGKRPHTPEGIAHFPVLGSPDQWESVLERTGARALIVAYPAATDDELLAELLDRCKKSHVDVELFSSVLATANLNFEHNEFSGCFRFYAKQEWRVAAQRVLKRALDVGIGFVGSIATLLLIPAVFALIRLEGRGPLFYRSAYLAQDGKTRYYLKFRTMCVGADRLLETDPTLRLRFCERHKLVDDPRITRIGHFLRKYSLDEFPQFFSVLLGTLTFVGPRTIRQEEAERYGPLLMKLLSVKPGVVGFWQVMGRQTTTYQERIHMDMFYIERWSIWLDLVIIAKSFWKVLKAEGAY